MKKSVSPTAVRLDGPEEPNPGLMSLTRTVPAAVPSLFQSSAPELGVKGRKDVKKRVLPTAVRLEPE